MSTPRDRLVRRFLDSPQGRQLVHGDDAERAARAAEATKALERLDKDALQQLTPLREARAAAMEKFVSCRTALAEAERAAAKASSALLVASAAIQTRRSELEAVIRAGEPQDMGALI